MFLFCGVVVSLLRAVKRFSGCNYACLTESKLRRMQQTAVLYYYLGKTNSTAQTKAERHHGTDEQHSTEYSITAQYGTAQNDAE